MRSLDDRILARLVLGSLVFTAALAVFAPALGSGFVAWDDGLYIRDNPLVRGLGAANLRWALAASDGGLWQPLTWLSLGLDAAAWGPEPWGFHLTNILLHAANGVLFYLVCGRLFERARPELGAAEAAVAAALAALFFVVHPLRVESVAWVSERKDVLAGFFWLAALLAWLEGARAAALTAFALSLSAKPTGVTLPAVFVVLEVYPLKRLPADPRRWLGRPLRPLWAAVSPFLGLSAAVFLLNAAAAHAAGVFSSFAGRGVVWRASQALYGLLFYPAKTVWPSGLSPYHAPRPWFGGFSPELAACSVLAAAAAAGIWRASRRRPALGAAAACYALALAPMSGLFQHGMACSAFERYSYLPCLGFAALFGAAFAGARPAARALAAAWLAALGVAAWGQCGVWRDSYTLWASAASREPNAFVVGNLGIALVESGRLEEGVARLEQAAAAAPGLSLPFDNLGVAYHRLGEEARARAAWRRGLALEATPELHARLGASLARGDAAGLAEGLAHLRVAVGLRPQAAELRADLGDALARAGRAGEARTQYAAAAGLDPALGRAQANWGLALAGQGLPAEAVAHYRRALYAPDSRAEAQHDWGSLLLEAGDLGAAERHLREAVRLEPGLARAQVNLGNVLVRRGRPSEAVARYRAALKADPGLAEARANLAAVERALAGKRRGA